jgi:hypothetical protein
VKDKRKENCPPEQMCEINWRTLRDGAEVYGYSDERSFRRVISSVMGVNRNSKRVYFSSGAIEVLSGRASFLVPEALRGGETLCIQLESGFTSSAILASINRGRTRITLEPVIPGAMVKMTEGYYSPGSIGIVKVHFDQDSGIIFYSH